MKASYRWLMDLLPDVDESPSRVADLLADRGAPVESLISPGAGLDDVVVGHVLEAGPHPNADRLSLCVVDGGAGLVQVVCGAPNVRAGGWYPFAPVGAHLPGDFKIKEAKIRGEVSQGMLCSSKELRLGTDHSGILELHGSFTPGERFVAALGLDDVTLDVEVTANRGDLLCHLGLARELAPAGGTGCVLPEIPGSRAADIQYVRAPGRAESGDISVEVRDPALCPRYLAAVIRGVKVGPSPEWLQRRLRGAGARPVNNVVDATNYVMLELGQPLHAFSLDRLSGSGIVVRRASEAEKCFKTLDDQERALDPNMLMIADRERPVAIAGVMGGSDSEVSGETTDLLLECAWFDPKSIRATRKALGLSTDASYRFERGVDREGMERAIERCIQVVLSTAGGELHGPLLDCHEGDQPPAVVSLRLSRVERLLGVSFSGKRVRELLAPLGFETLSEAEDGTLEVRIPGFRARDVTREVDLIEEVARTHGYDAFPVELGAYRPGTVPDHPLFILEDELRSDLVGRGLFEAQTPAFVPPGEGNVEVSNPLAATEPFLRSAILPSLLRRVTYNLMRGNRDVRLFEIGTSFQGAEKRAPPREETHLAAVLTGSRAPEHWSAPSEPFDIWDLKGLMAGLARRIYPHGARIEEDTHAEVPFVPGAAFVVLDGSGAIVGRGGRIRDTEVDTPAWSGPVFGFEVSLPSEPPPPPVPAHVPLAQFPAVERDLALLVPPSVPAGEVGNRIREGADPTLEAVTIFDLYRGPGIPDDTRSIGFRLRFRAKERTLQDDQVDRSIAKLLALLSEEFGVRPRE